MIPMAQPPHILLGVTGSIAAYKAVELTRMMKTRGWDVTVIMTREATEFVGELTFRTISRNPVALDMFAKVDEWKPEHISLADRASVLVIAPCTANVIAKLAHGLADDTLTCAALATRAPLVIAPAMNGKMWEHVATRDNVEIMRRRGAVIVDVETGGLACGYEGSGRLASLDKIVATVEAVMKKRPAMRSKRSR